MRYSCQAMQRKLLCTPIVVFFTLRLLEHRRSAFTVLRLQVATSFYWRRCVRWRKACDVATVPSERWIIVGNQSSGTIDVFPIGPFCWSSRRIAIIDVLSSLRVFFSSVYRERKGCTDSVQHAGRKDRFPSLSITQPLACVCLCISVESIAIIERSS